MIYPSQWSPILSESAWKIKHFISLGSQNILEKKKKWKLHILVSEYFLLSLKERHIEQSNYRVEVVFYVYQALQTHPLPFQAGIQNTTLSLPSIPFCLTT